MALVDRVPADGVVRSGAEAVFRWVPLGILIGLWSLISGRVVPTEVLSPPLEVFARIVTLLANGDILFHLGLSLVRTGIGLALGIVVGVALGISMARSEPIENAFHVILKILYVTPKVALVPLAILWLGIGTQTTVLVIFLATLLPIVTNTYNAAEDVDEKILWVARMMGTSDRNVLRRVVFPATIPQILTGIRQAVPIAFIALVGAELVASDAGIGSLVMRYGQLGDYPSMFAVIIVFSTVAYFSVRAFERVRGGVLVWN